MRRVLPPLLGLAVLLTATLAAGWRAYRAGYWRFNHPDPARYPVRGIDVSHHQGKIDWVRVAADGWRFAYIKASEGGSFRSAKFAELWEGAKAAGLARGAYHFFTFCKPGAEQAANFLAMLPGDKDALPPVVDFEFVGNCRERPPVEKVRQELNAFRDAVRAKTGREPVIYVTRGAYARYLDGAVPGAPIWLRDVFREPQPLPGTKLVLWQYADNVRVDGIKRPADADVFVGEEVNRSRVPVN